MTAKSETHREAGLGAWRQRPLRAAKAGQAPLHRALGVVPYVSFFQMLQRKGSEPPCLPLGLCPHLSLAHYKEVVRILAE